VNVFVLSANGIAFHAPIRYRPSQSFPFTIGVAAMRSLLRGALGVVLLTAGCANRNYVQSDKPTEGGGFWGGMVASMFSGPKQQQVEMDSGRGFIPARDAMPNGEPLDMRTR
jgi:hypothetical protein